MLKDFLTPELVQALVGLFILLINGVAIPRVLAWAKVSLDDKQRALIETAIRNGLNYAVNTVVNRSDDVTLKRAIREVLEKGDLKNEVIRQATAYVRQSIPSALAKMGVANSDDLYVKIEGRFAEIMAEMANSADRTERVVGRS